ncbi:MAG: T9SS type A sorting domain-containing protein [Bacteroidota bacterium]
MTKKIIQCLLILLLFSANCIIAQQLHPCGTVTGRSKWLKQYQAHPDRFSKGSDNTIYVPMTIHILGTNTGSGYFRLPNFLDAFCRLNTDFEGTNLHFYINGEINYINNTAWYQHDDILTGVEMMFENNIENTLNVYFVDSPAGNCGYNLPYAGIANAKACSDPDDHTWAHEVGHALSIPHPFLGWEGGVAHDGSINHNFNEPAPREVYYDYTLFKDQLYLDTLIIDTALVELVDGSNCFEAADGFCDTKPDYVAQRWQCNSAGRSRVTQTDPDGQQFTSDGSLIMGYSLDQCSSRFTQEQIAAMRANLLDQKASWLNDDPPLGTVNTDPIVVNSPFNEEITAAENIYFEWDAVENATHYILQVSRLSSFAFSEVDVVVEGNSFEVESLRADRKYYWRIRPYNHYSACTTYSEISEFQTSSSVTSTEQITENLDIEIYPNLIQKGESIQIHANSTSQDFTLTIYSLDGRRWQEEKLDLHHGTSNLPFRFAKSGIYLLEMKNEKGIQIEKIIVQ